MNFFLLDSATTATEPAAQGGGLQMLIFPILIVAVMYFFILRPQSKRTKDEATFRESLKKGDKIVTIGGIHGRIESMDDTTVMILVDTDVKLKMAKEAIRPAPDNDATK